MKPPELAGYVPVRLLGSGGYSDVFLYEQQMPRRQVAIKVLVSHDLGDSGRQQFFDEANSMAAVSTHPYIVTVFEAQVSPDGYPYLVMEFYPRANFSIRSRSEKLSVSEVLRTGIRVASAVETAHRAGILHRDLKPANILTSEYDRPGLTDFGISTSVTGASAASGLSIPWAPPEIVDASAVGDETTDVYSLAATVYSLLAGRSPFEVPGGNNRTLDLIQRISDGVLADTGREDVPDSLERVLRHGMSRSPVDRPNSPEQFAYMLQSVEVELGLPPTPLEVRSDPRDVRSRDDEPDVDSTRLKGPVVIHPQGTDGRHSPGTAPGGGIGDTTGSETAGRRTVEGLKRDETSGRDSDSVPQGDVADHGSTVHRIPTGSGGEGLISGIGSIPVGLSGRSRPVAAGSGDHGDGEVAEAVDRPTIAQTTQVGPAGPEAETVDQPRRRGVSLVGVAAIVLAFIVVLVVVKVVVGAGSIDDGVDEVTESTPDLPRGPRTRPPSPSSVTVSEDGRRTVVAWEHTDQDPADYTYTVVNLSSETPLAQVTAVTQVELDSAAECVRVTAKRLAGGPSSELHTSQNTNCRG